MKLQTKVPLQPEQYQIDYQSKTLLLGSCFVENIGKKLEYYKFQNLHNPSGILFNPIVIEQLIKYSIEGKQYSEDDVFFNNERWHSYDAHSDLSSTSREELIQNLNESLKATNQKIEECSHVIITLGTAWVYRLIETNSVVANCHKVPQKEFNKELLSIDIIVDSLKKMVSNIRKVNADAAIIFTVSPVRHLKDGFIENQQSKAHLISSIHEVLSLQGESRNLYYFPSYEIMMDELRDYRFYREDMIHPNTTAINYIWDKFKTVWISPKIHPTMSEVETLQKGLLHKPFNQESKEYKAFQKDLERKKSHLEQQFPFMQF